MAFTIDKQVIKNPEGKIKFWKPDGNSPEHYHLGVWVEASDQELDLVERVEYTLHPSFKRPVRSSANRSNKFSITFWTWGMFMIDVVLYLHDGTTRQIQYYLSYDLPEDDGTNYVRVEE